MVYYLYHSLPNVNCKQKLWIKASKFGEEFPNKTKSNVFMKDTHGVFTMIIFLLAAARRG